LAQIKKLLTTIFLIKITIDVR